MEETKNCGDITDNYIKVMNVMKEKTKIARSLLSDIVGEDKTYHFLGSYLTYPEENGEKLKKKYGKSNDGDLFDKVKKKMGEDLQKIIVKPEVKYVCFLVGSIISDNDVNHHVGFIYDKERGILRVMDSGIRSWDKNLAKTVMKLVREVFVINVEVHTYSQKMSCFKKNPQDITLGGFLGEVKTYFSSEITRDNRERFCQSWSMLLMLTDIERLKNDPFYNISDPYMEYWDKNSSSLEYCIRRFILWVVKKFETEVFSDFVGCDIGFLDELKTCFRRYIPNIEIPTDQDTICEGINIR